MTAQNPALYLQGENHPAEDFRHLITKTWGSRPGVIGEDDLAVTEKSGTADMSVDVAGGSVLVEGTEGTYQGLYLCENRGTTNLVISSSDPTNDRYDLVVAQVEDSDYSGATDAWKLAIVTGTPAATPLFPTVPDNALVLATVLVQNGVSSILDADITDIRDASDSDGTTTLDNLGFATATGGLTVCTASTRPTAGIYNGMQIFETDTTKIYLYNGTRWVWISGGPTSELLDNTNVSSTIDTYVGAGSSLELGTWTVTEPGVYLVQVSGYWNSNCSSATLHVARTLGNGSAVNTCAWTHPGGTVTRNSSVSTGQIFNLNSGDVPYTMSAETYIDADNGTQQAIVDVNMVRIGPNWS